MAVSFCDGVLELKQQRILLYHAQGVSAQGVSAYKIVHLLQEEGLKTSKTGVPQEVRSDTSALAIIGVPFSFQDFVAALIVIFSAPLYRTLTHARTANHKQALYQTLTHAQQATNRYWSRRQTHTVLCFHSTTTC